MLKVKARSILAPVYLHGGLHMLKLEMNYGKRIKDLMTFRGIKTKELSERMDVSPSFVSQLLSGNRKPGRDVMIKLAQSFNVELGELFPDNTYPAHMPRGVVPVVSWAKAGDWGKDMKEYSPSLAEEWVTYDAKNKCTFALRVKGGSMEPEYLDGDIIIVNCSLDARIGDDIIAKVKDGVTFKRLRQLGDRILLSPINPKEGTDIIINGEELKFYKTVGVIEGLVRKKRRK